MTNVVQLGRARDGTACNRGETEARAEAACGAQRCELAAGAPQEVSSGCLVARERRRGCGSARRRDRCGSNAPRSRPQLRRPAGSCARDDGFVVYVRRDLGVRAHGRPVAWSVGRLGDGPCSGCRGCPFSCCCRHPPDDPGRGRCCPSMQSSAGPTRGDRSGVVPLAIGGKEECDALTARPVQCRRVRVQRLLLHRVLLHHVPPAVFCQQARALRGVRLSHAKCPSPWGRPVSEWSGRRGSNPRHSAWESGNMRGHSPVAHPVGHHNKFCAKALQVPIDLSAAGEAPRF